MRKVLKGLELEEIRCPDEVEIAIRQKEDKKLIFLMNFSDKSSEVSLSREYVDLITEKKLSGKVEIDPFGVMLLI